jgi:hypothetical protein
MPKQACVLAVLVFVGLPGCARKTSSHCPKDMAEVPARAVPGKSIWCQTKDAARAHWVEWYPNTTRPRQSCNFYRDQPEGSFTAWYSDGKPWVQGQFVDGQKTGKWQQWDISGNLVAEGDYRGGRLIAGAPVAGMAGCDRALKH